MVCQVAYRPTNKLRFTRQKLCCCVVMGASAKAWDVVLETFEQNWLRLVVFAVVQCDAYLLTVSRRLYTAVSKQLSNELENGDFPLPL